MQKNYWGALVLGALWAVQAAAAESHEIPYAAALYAHEFGDESRASSRGNGYQLTFGLPVSLTNTAVELSFYDVGRERHADGNSDYQTVLMLDVMRDVGLFGWSGSSAGGYLPKFRPFGLAGIGAVQEDVRGDKHYHLGGNVGAGLLFPLPWYGAAVRTEGRVQLQGNSKSVAGEDILIDYRFVIGLQVPLSPLFKEPVVATPRADECDLAVVDLNGAPRGDCGSDADHDGVPDDQDQCPGTPEGLPVDGKGCPAATGSGDADQDGVPDAADACPNTKKGMKVDQDGCAVGQSYSLKGVHFEHNSARLTEDSKAFLDEVARSLKGQPNADVEIAGYTDNHGSAAYNLALSKQRSESVRQYLISRGVGAGRMVARGYGKSYPKASNGSEKGRRENRRVEVKLILE